jgi:hypothetical protein
MVSRLSPAQSEFPDDLMVAESPSLRRRSTEPEFSERPLLLDRPSLPKRASRAFVRYLFAVCVGIAGTLAWQSYGEASKQMVAGWAAQYGWSLPWLSAHEAGEPTPGATQAIAPAVPSPDRQQLDAMAGSLTAVQQRIEQLAAGQEQMAGDIAKLHAAEQEIRHQIAAAAQRPAAPAAKPAPATAPATRPATLPR